MSAKASKSRSLKRSVKRHLHNLEEDAKVCKIVHGPMSHQDVGISHSSTSSHDAATRSGTIISVSTEGEVGLVSSLEESDLEFSQVEEGGFGTNSESSWDFNTP